jgi:hypothetical protein
MSKGADFIGPRQPHIPCPSPADFHDSEALTPDMSVKELAVAAD